MSGSPFQDRSGASSEGRSDTAAPSERSEPELLAALIRLVTHRARALQAARTAADEVAIERLREAVDALGGYLDAVDAVRRSPVGWADAAGGTGGDRPARAGQSPLAEEEPPGDRDPRGAPFDALPFAPLVWSSRPSPPPSAAEDSGRVADPTQGTDATPAARVSPSRGAFDAAPPQAAPTTRGATGVPPEAGAGMAEGGESERDSEADRAFPPFRDQVTGLHSREGFDAVAGGELKRCRRHGRLFALLLFQIPTGEPAAVRRAATALGAATRESDLAGRHMDGTLAVALPETSGVQARAVAERIMRHLEGVGMWSAANHLGLVLHPTHGETLHQLLEAARAQLTLPARRVLETAESGGYWPA